MTATNSTNQPVVACRPPLDGPLLRTVSPVPPALRLDDVGALCPLDDVVLDRQVDGWACPACGAAWDSAGRDGWWPITASVDGELVDQDDAGTSGTSRRTRIALVSVVAPGLAAATVDLGRRYAEHASAVPEQLVYAPAVAVGLAGAVLAGRRVVRWVGEHRHPLAVDVDEADLDPLGKELLAQVRARRGEAS
ncbi:hypothetical protein FHG89_14150 [Micromonospora orduensis]|uniref:Uncharacterized protein n=1 Tax=Micromonospora orduensis TaxID=1420891 RepID=A0A5C4QPN4_9ACTN|nr:hypothetical protein [Micromonospora orduensis]TNH28781.1 hypothetical protein FHG89_14150 [Micromonospora orduensis]